jgi:hypothetical protein
VVGEVQVVGLVLVIDYDSYLNSNLKKIGPEKIVKNINV